MEFTHLGETAGLGAAMCWTVTALAFESAGKRIGSLAVNQIRLFMALVLLTLYCWIVRGQPLALDATAHNWIWLSVSGLVGFCVGDLCLFQALVVMGSRRSTLVMALVPSVTALVGWIFLGEVLTALDLTGMVLTQVGVVLVVLERDDDGEGKKKGIPVVGILLGLGGAVGQAVGLVLSKHGMGDYNAVQSTQIRVMAGIVGFGVIFLFTGHWPKIFGAFKDGRAMAGTALGAAFGPFLGVIFSLLAVQHTETGVASTLMALAPVLIIPPAVIIQKEKIGWRAVVGAVVAVIGCALLFL